MDQKNRDLTTITNEPILLRQPNNETSPNIPAVVSKLLFFFVPLYFFVSILMQMLRGDNPWVFLDYANLAIHEAGHLVFYALGFFAHMIGGSFAQLLIPLLLTWYFYAQRDWYAVAFGVFWTGQSLVNVSVYIGDARTQDLPLVQMSEAALHDWNWILSQLGLLHFDKVISTVGYTFAFVLMLAGLLGMIVNTLLSFQKTNQSL